MQRHWDTKWHRVGWGVETVGGESREGDSGCARESGLEVGVTPSFPKGYWGCCGRDRQKEPQGPGAEHCPQQRNEMRLEVLASRTSPANSRGTWQELGGSTAPPRQALVS